MHNGMKLEEMLAEVVRHSRVKRDFVADTKEHIAMVPMPDFPDRVALVLSREESNVLERFQITENCHQQIASRLKIPMKYYERLLKDYPDLVMRNVNTLFQREPALRMVRTLDGKARAFLSNSFRRVDNEQILEQTLPVIRNEYDTVLLNTFVDEDNMRMKCLFTGDEHKVDVGPRAGDGGPDFVHAGFEMGNSEVGKGSFYIRGFLYRSFCKNGCVWNSEETASFKQIHVGSRLGVTENMLLSNETMRKEDDLIISAARDVLANLSSPEFTQKVGARLRALRNTKAVASPIEAVAAVCEELRMTEKESATVLESFIADRDYTQWGMVNAVTAAANVVEDYNRASRIEELGASLLNMDLKRWNKIAALEAAA